MVRPRAWPEMVVAPSCRLEEPPDISVTLLPLIWNEIPVPLSNSASASEGSSEPETARDFRPATWSGLYRICKLVCMPNWVSALDSG
ncbi:hypothetical protein D3C84_829700 [compost metagenome]